MARPKKTTEGATYETQATDLARMDTGLYSFNWAIGGGLPYRSIIEISGWEWSGKTTLSLYLSALANPKGLIGIADIEPMQDLSYLKRIHALTGFTGHVRFAKFANRDGEPVDSAARLSEVADMLYEPTFAGFIVDSVGAIYPLSEEEGEVGEARVGERARIMGPFMRKAASRLNTIKKNGLGIITNHVHSVIGGRGTETSGGKAVHYLSTTRVRLSSDRSEDGLWIVNGKMVKRRFWGATPPPDVFQVAIVPGEGVHPGLTAVLDSLMYKIATKDRTITLNGKNYGFLSKLVEARDDEDRFEPFRVALERYAKE